MLSWLKNIWNSLFSSNIIAKIVIARIIANNRERADGLIVTADKVLSAMGKLHGTMSYDAFDYLVRKEADKLALLPEELLLLNEVLAAIKSDLSAREIRVFDAKPLLQWLAKQ